MATLTPFTARRIVVKIGSALLVDRETGNLRRAWLESVCADVAALRKAGIEVVLVSSGSVALGRGRLKLPAGVLPVEQAQAAAAAGQISLARAYDEALSPYGLSAAQILLTLENTVDRRRYLNARSTLSTLLSLGAVPIVNENDTVATDEIRFGDNDRLAAQIAVTVGADQLILLSDVDGLYTANPHSDPTARHLPEIADITSEIDAMAGDPVSGLSKGGMRTKVLAARTATASGCALCITNGGVDNPLAALRDGARASWFLPRLDPKTARKAWILAMKPQGVLEIDEGAANALAHGRSLLPAGVAKVMGRFGRGDAVSITGPKGRILGMGLTRYTSDETRLIAGRRSEEIPEILGYPGRASLIHRDDMAL
ncbi:glutamate 5-kinase [Palleronia marisminoris]|uniref:Glutamate 5-kinase n=1 Tax=Palleronia marisminoris TaxID=315423 RepID=A0A1Y5R6W9_9RHOB|nr:glutamate 5-kinase [Palleronia marisminoris]SFG05191.1 glutamate 5-kinase [Palleronia marisminoris]SLN10274.1 Glutamate 5-kinase [Palleronia marisminoris]